SHRSGAAAFPLTLPLSRLPYEVLGAQHEDVPAHHHDRRRERGVLCGDDLVYRDAPRLRDHSVGRASWGSAKPLASTIFHSFQRVAGGGCEIHNEGLRGILTLNLPPKLPPTNGRLPMVWTLGSDGLGSRPPWTRRTSAFARFVLTPSPS